MNHKNILFLIFSTFTMMWTGCYSFQGTSIPADVSSYFVERFEVRANNAIPTLGQTLSESLKDKIRSESNLKQQEVDPDIEFKGVVTDYHVSAEAPQAGALTGFNRLTISVSVDYIYKKDEKKGWKERFSVFADFPSNTNLISVQDQLIEDIKEEIIEKIYNKAFNNW